MNVMGGMQAEDDPSEQDNGPAEVVPGPSPDARPDRLGGTFPSLRCELARLSTPIAEALDHPPVGLVLVELTPDDQSVHWDGVHNLVDSEHGPLDRTVELGPNRLAVVKAGLTAPAQAEGYSLRIHEAIRTEHRCRAAIGVAVSRPGDPSNLLLRLAVDALEQAQALGRDIVVISDDEDRDRHLD